MNSAGEQTDRLNANGPASTESRPPTSGRSNFRRNFPQSADHSGVFEPPDTLANADTRHFLFHGSSFLFLGAFWFLICFGLYVYASGYHVNTLYEARWMLSTLLITAFLCILFHFNRVESIFIACWISNIYTLCASFITTLIYALNFHRTVNIKMSFFQRKIMSPGRQPYMILSLCLIIVSLFGLTAVVWLSSRLYRLASWHYKNLNIRRKVRLNLFLVSGGQWWLAVFTIYVTKQVIMLKAPFIHTYMIQELFCALVLLALSMHQMFFLFRPNKIALKVILFLNVCQALQELFYAWNAYYVSLYIHSSKNKAIMGLGVDYDQVIMTLNFVGHIVRLSLSAYSCWKLITVTDLGLKLSNAVLQTDVDKGVLKFVILIAAASLLISAAHVFMDILYASMQHMYRTLIAFTGISVFYASIVGVSLSVFLRNRHTIFLVLAAVFSLLLVGVSVHAVYIYLETSFSGFLVDHLHSLARSKVKPSVMHYFEAVFALCGMVLGSATTFFLARILRMESPHESREKFGWPLRWLRYQVPIS